MEAELQILCFSSPGPCASSPDLHVHLDLSLLVLLLAILEEFLVFLGVEKLQKRWSGGCGWDGVRWMDGNGMGDDGSDRLGIDAMVVWWLLWTFSNCGGGVTRGGEVVSFLYFPAHGCTWVVSSFLHFIAFWGFLPSKLIPSFSFGSNVFELLLIF